MFNEDLIIKIKQCECLDERKAMMEELYFSNFGLIIALCKQYSRNANYMDDLLQLAYIGLEKSVKYYKIDGGHSFLSYFRTWVKHECYKFWLDSGQPHELCCGYANADVCADENYNNTNEMFSLVEASFMSAFLWNSVKALVSARNLQIIYLRFVKQRTYKCIAEEVGLTIEGVRQCIKRCCYQLGLNETIQEIAMYYEYL